MIRRYSIVVDPSNASVLYCGADAEKAKELIRSRKSDGKAVAGWINIRPEKRFTPSPTEAKPVKPKAKAE
jgi:hypothetical protein